MGNPPKINDRKDKTTMSKNEIRKTVHFLIEQACRSIWIMDWGPDNANFKDFAEAVTHLAADEPELLTQFTAHTANAMSKEAQSKEYAPKDYGGATLDADAAIANLIALAAYPDTLKPARDTLNRVAKYLADFHDAGNTEISQADIAAAVNLLTEQACFVLQANGTKTDTFNDCEQAVRYLVKGDPELLKPFKDRTQAVKHDPDADYDTKQYDGKEAEIRTAVTCLTNLAKKIGTPADKKEILNRCASLIAEFYGMEDAVLKMA